MDVEKFKVELRSLKKGNEIQGEDLDLRFKDVQAHFKEMLSEADKYYVETFDDIKAELQKVRVFAKDSVRGKEQALNDSVIKQTNDLRRLVDDNVDEIVRERRDMITKNET